MYVNFYAKFPFVQVIHSYLQVYAHSQFLINKFLFYDQYIQVLLIFMFFNCHRHAKIFVSCQL